MVRQTLMALCNAIALSRTVIRYLIRNEDTLPGTFISTDIAVTSSRNYAASGYTVDIARFAYIYSVVIKDADL